MKLTLEIEGEGAQDPLPGGGADLVAFMSFALARGLGAQHPLIALAELLHGSHHVRLGPLTTFYEEAAADAEDLEKLERAWQDPGPLRESLEGLALALETDEQAQSLAGRAAAGGLAGQARALVAPLRAAGAAGKRVRLVYAL